LKHQPRLTAVALCISCLCASRACATPEAGWRTLQNGVQYATFQIKSPSGVGDGVLHVVRVDPALAHIEAALASERGDGRRSAAEWCKTANLAVAINAGMFGSDGLSNVGYLRAGKHINNRRWNGYRSVLGLYPRDRKFPITSWLDLGTKQPSQSLLGGYSVVVQNLRLIRAPGENCWAQSEKRWSEAAVAIDRKGRILLLFSRSPLSMAEFNRSVLSLPLGIRQAMHVEGGPEASLSIHTGGVDLDLCGSYETGFEPDDSNTKQWPIPNVLGVALSH
jgi:hypothetical protein